MNLEGAEIRENLTVSNHIRSLEASRLTVGGTFDLTLYPSQRVVPCASKINVLKLQSVGGATIAIEGDCEVDRVQLYDGDTSLLRQARERGCRGRLTT